MSIAQNVNFLSMWHGVVLVAHRGEGFVYVEFIREHLRTLFNVLSDNREDGTALDVLNCSDFQLPTTFNHSENSRLAFRAAAACTFANTAKVRLVGFNFACEWIKILRQNITYFLAHSPSGFVRDTRFPLNLLGRDTAASLRHEINHIEPDGQRGRGLVKNGVRSWRNLITAMVASVDLTPVRTMEKAVDAAIRAINSLREFLIADVIKTNIIIWKRLLKVFERVLHHRRFVVFSSHFASSL